MPNDDHAWQCYGELQELSRNEPRVGDHAWGVESALNYLLSAIETANISPNPSELELAVNRTVATGARLYRSRAMALKKRTRQSPQKSDPPAIAKIELTRIGGLVKDNDATILLEAGLGFTDREIADRHASTPGAVRIRLSRLRSKLRLHLRQAQTPTVH
jgi:DNA-directed RNA polymerase specialized sigma24 family protein